MKSNYEALDAAIIEAVKANTAYNPAAANTVRQEAGRIAASTGRDEWRIAEGRLQALRKAGKIKADRKAWCGWVLIEEETC